MQEDKFPTSLDISKIKIEDVDKGDALDSQATVRVSLNRRFNVDESNLRRSSRKKPYIMRADYSIDERD